MTQKVFPQGNSGEIAVPASSKIAVFSASKFNVYQLLGYPNVPSQKVLLHAGAAGETYTSAAFSAAATVVVEAGPSDAYYEVGVVPSVSVPQASQGNLRFVNQSAPTEKADGNQSVTAAQLINGICVHTITTGRTLTTPTGAQILAACPSDIAVGDSFEFTLITLGAGADDIATLTAGDGDVTFVGDVTVGPGAAGTTSAGTWRFRYTGSNAFVGYRIG